MGHNVTWVQLRLPLNTFQELVTSIRNLLGGQRTRALMAFQMLCLREPPFAVPTFLREEAPVPVLHWTARHHLRSAVLVWGYLLGCEGSTSPVQLCLDKRSSICKYRRSW